MSDLVREYEIQNLLKDGGFIHDFDHNLPRCYVRLRVPGNTDQELGIQFTEIETEKSSRLSIYYPDMRPRACQSEFWPAINKTKQREVALGPSVILEHVNL
jgi:hypothetical protein